MSLSIASRGNIKTQTLRAFSAAEMSKIVEKMM
jgi:uncharacterized protein with GYD domain